MRVRKRKYPSGRVKWQLDLAYVEGKRVQQTFDTREEALGALAEAKAKRKNGGTSALTLSETDRAAFIRARERLAEVGATIEQAVVFFIENRKEAIAERVLLPDLLERCVAEKERLGKSTRYVQQFRCSCLSFIRGREDKSADEISREEVKAWVHGNGWQAKTQRVYLGDLRTLFSFAVGNRFATANPCNGEGSEKISLATLVAAPIQTLTAKQSESILTRAARVPDGDDEEDFRPLLTYLALGLFCGIRPAELERLARAAVSVSERHVVIEASQSKTRRRRVVDISENCVAWLNLDPTEGGLVCPVNFRRRWERLRKAAGVPWSHDVMRHTFASMHYAAHQNESLLKAQMGHSAAEDVLFRHYRALKTRAEAAAFWGIVPPVSSEPR